MLYVYIWLWRTCHYYDLTVIILAEGSESVFVVKLNVRLSVLLPHHLQELFIVQAAWSEEHRERDQYFILPLKSEAINTEIEIHLDIHPEMIDGNFHSRNYKFDNFS